MAKSGTEKRACSQCTILQTYMCDGCEKRFCFSHLNEHRQELSESMTNICQEHETLKQDFNRQAISVKLLAEIDSWEQDFIQNTKNAILLVRNDVEKITDKLKQHICTLINNLSEELELNRQQETYDNVELNQWKEKLKETRMELETLCGIQLVYDNNLKIRPITIQVPADQLNKLSNDEVVSHQRVFFGINQSTDANLVSLFEYLQNLSPTNKCGLFSGNCSSQTDQMEQFLSEAFGFKNIPNKEIVASVKAFQLSTPPTSLRPTAQICFPSNNTSLFKMTAAEIMNWQRSYRVYIDRNIQGINNKSLIKQALQGNIKGEEAFRMKFVVRIATCPILMEFDSKIIPRQLNEDWPNRIKLVSATGINLACSQRDVNDIWYYISNGKKVFPNDSKPNVTPSLNVPQSSQASNQLAWTLHEERVRHSLMRMIRLRLTACDEEGVQIVVETGVGLGANASGQYEIDAKLRALTAETIRTILQRDGLTYKNIRAVIFALPVFNWGKDKDCIANCFDDYINEFQQSNYDGPIPVLVANQDMHRLTVAIARRGFIVSELSPADSHCVFGEYWQNKTPAVEEKIALSTLGLLVQHHLITLEVLKEKNYYFKTIGDGSIIDCKAAINDQN